MAYVSSAVFTDYIRNEIGAIDSASISGALAAAHRAVDWYTCRNFDVAGSATARTYSGNGARWLSIDDCTTITSVSVLGASLAAADFQKEPAGALDITGRASVYTRLCRLNYGYWYDNASGADIVVTATWGWPATPDEVVEATKIVGKGIVEMRNSRGGVIAETTFGPVRVSRQIVSQAASLLDPLRRGDRAFGIA